MSRARKRGKLERLRDVSERTFREKSGENNQNNRSQNSDRTCKCIVKIQMTNDSIIIFFTTFAGILGDRGGFPPFSAPSIFPRGFS